MSLLRKNQVSLENTCPYSSSQSKNHSTQYSVQHSTQYNISQHNSSQYNSSTQHSSYTHELSSQNSTEQSQGIKRDSSLNSQTSFNYSRDEPDMLDKRPDLIKNSNYFTQVIKVSWNIIEAEILGNERFQLGHDIERFYELNQQLTMDDLARRKYTHSQVCLVRVIGRLVKNLDNPGAVQHYLHCVGRLHQLAGVDIEYLDISGTAFCQALDSIEQHRELWSPQVKATWNLLFVMIVKMMKEGYNENIYKKLSSLSFEHRNLVGDVWSVLQENAIKYVSNTMFLPLIVRSNKSLQKYFSGFEQALLGMNINELYSPKFDRTKHGSLFLSKVLVRVFPHLEQLEVVFPYLRELGVIHQKHGVKRHHIDLVGLAYCWAIRAVIQGTGVKGGPLHDTTKAWISLVQVICWGIKQGYSPELEKEVDPEIQEFQVTSPGDCSVKWRRSLRSGSEGSCRLLEKRGGVMFNEGALLDNSWGKPKLRRRTTTKMKNMFCCS